MSYGRVYLAGPITGLSFGDATDWRDGAVKWLTDVNIEALSPMRWKRYLEKERDLKAEGYAQFPLSSPKGITTRDRFDSMRVDVLLVNLLGAAKVSIGTCMELGWADAARVPIIAVIESAGNPHDHAMVNEVVGFRVPTLEAGLQIARAILTPEV